MNRSSGLPITLRRSLRFPTAFAALALLAGTIIARLPAPTMALVLGTAVLLVLALIEPKAGVVILLLLAPLKALFETETAYPLPLDVGQIALAAVVICWLLNRIARREPLALRGSPVQIPLLLFTLAAALSLPGAISVGTGLEELLKWIEMILLVSFCRALYRRQDVHWLVFALILAGGIQATIGLYEFFGGSGAAHLWILDNRYFRAFGTFGQPNPFGGFMGLILPIALVTALGYGSQVWQALRADGRSTLRQEQTQIALFSAAFYGVMTGVIGAGLLASWSRGAWIGFAAALMGMILFAFRSPVRALTFAVVAALLALALGSSGLLPASLTERMGGFLEEFTMLGDARGLDITDANYAVLERLAHWQSATWMAADHPWLGVGFGNYEAAYPRYALLNWPLALGHAHNYYLNLLAEVGLVGLAAYILAWGMILILSIRLWRHSAGLPRAWSVGLLGAWFHLTIHSLVDKLYVNNLFLHLGCMLGLLAVLFAVDERH